MTLSLNASHPSTNDLQYDTHSLFGHMECKVTHDVLTEGADKLADFKDKRQFILSRSTFSGTGQWASHWTGDNHRTFEDMRWSIANLFNFNMFGIPHVGADVCGFFACPNDPRLECLTDDEQQELCGRWMQLATFYPFARQHRDKDGPANEPYNLKDEFKTMAIASIQERYKYMRFMYQCLQSASQDGNTCIDPLFFHYPTLEGTFDDIESTFMVGDVLKVSPVMELKKEKENYSVFFPKGNWVSMNDYSVLSVAKEEGEMVDLPFPYSTIHTHLKPGGIVNIVDDIAGVMTAADLATKGYTLVVNRD